MSVLTRVVACSLMALPAAACSQAFQNITIKVSHSADPRSMRMEVLPDGDLIANAVPIVTLLSYAYAVPSNPSPRLNSLPGWAVSARYDIEANAPPKAITPNLQGREGQIQLQQMIRRLLAERFGLVMRVQHERMSVYALIAAQGGVKLQPSAITGKDCVFDTAPEGCHTFAIGFGHPLVARAVNMEDLARYIENWMDLPVVNRTKLSGLFAMNTEGWLPMRLPPPPNAIAAPNLFAGLPTIFTVLGKRGLELHKQTEIMPVYTIERIHPPAAN